MKVQGRMLNHIELPKKHLEGGGGELVFLNYNFLKILFENLITKFES